MFCLWAVASNAVEYVTWTWSRAGIYEVPVEYRESPDGTNWFGWGGLNRGNGQGFGMSGYAPTQYELRVGLVNTNGNRVAGYCWMGTHKLGTPNEVIPLDPCVAYNPYDPSTNYCVNVDVTNASPQSQVVEAYMVPPGVAGGVAAGLYAAKNRGKLISRAVVAARSVCRLNPYVAAGTLAGGAAVYVLTKWFDSLGVGNETSSAVVPLTAPANAADCWKTPAAVVVSPAPLTEGQQAIDDANRPLENDPNEKEEQTNSAPPMPDVAAQAASGQTAAGAGSGIIGNKIAGFGLVPEIPSSEPVFPMEITWKVLGRVWKVDCNPFTRAWVNSLAYWCRQVITWGTYAALYAWLAHLIYETMIGAGAWRQAQAAGQQILGTNVNTGAAMVGASLITAAMYALLAFMLDCLWAPVTGSGVSTNAGATMSKVWTAPSSVEIQWSIWAVGQFVPYSVLVACTVARIVYSLTCMQALWVAQTVTRFIVC